MTTEIIVRNVDVIAAEICSIKDQTRKIVLGNSIEIGKRLVEAKDIVPHGEWGNWLEQSVDYSQSTANNLMKIFMEYGANQLALFGSDAKSQALGNLSYTQAVALLGVPAEEREEFVEKNDVKAMSTRELQAVIKEKQALLKQLKDTEEKMKEIKKSSDLIDQKYNVLDKQNREDAESLKQVRSELEAAQNSGNSKEVAKLKKDLQKAEKASEASQKRLADLEAGLAEKVKIREAELESQMADKLAKREQELADQAKQVKEETAKQLADMQEQMVKNNNTAVIKVTVCFDTLVENFKALLAAVGDIENPEEKDKFKSAVAKLCDKMKGYV